MQTHSQSGRYGSPTPCLLHLAIPSPVTSCFPSPSRALRVEQTRPAACPATGWLRPRSWRSPRQLGVTRTRTLRPDAQPSPASPGPQSGSTTSCSATCPLRGYSAVQPDPLSAPRTAQPTPEGSQVPRESGREKKNLLFTGSERPQLGFASLFLWFLFSRFLGLEKKGWQPRIHPGREWGWGSGESEFIERSPDFWSSRTRSQEQRG